jgi:hypothetical protein
MKYRNLAFMVSGVAMLALLPTWASAQSTIQGVVRDASGAIIPNVTVVASSPALIEQSRTVNTNGEGRYEIIDVRPGSYSVRFSVSGFATQERNNVVVTANTSVPLNVEMVVGSTGETVQVEATVAVVDTENAANHQVLTREIQDAIPAPRNMQALGGLTPGVQLHNASGGNPDVGGSQQMEQTYITGHGSNANQTTVLLDGMNINTNYLDGTIQNYVDNGIVAEATYQTSAISAEVSAGGVLVNQIPRDGSNQLHADIFASGTGSGSPWQGSNLTQDLVDRFKPFNLPAGVNGIVHIEDFNATLGGPIIRNKLWFLTSGRYQSTFDTVNGVNNLDGTKAVEDQHITQGVMRLSWQISSKDKFSGTYDRIQKQKGHELSGLATVPTDPSVSASRRGPPLYYVAQGKWTRVQSPNLLFDAGFSTDILHFSVIYLPGEEEKPATATTYLTDPRSPSIAHVSKVDSTLGIRYNAPPAQSYLLSDKRNIASSVTYIVHSHIIKAGVTDSWGKNDSVGSLNGDLYENFSNGTPTSVTVFNSPTAVRQRQVADVGVFVTDTWHIKRLSLTAGVRFEYEKSALLASAIPAGRFQPARSYGQFDCSNVPGLGCWKTFSPRIGGVYDLFGDGKTAIKASFGTYNIPQVTGYLTRFNPLASTTETRTWTDVPRDPVTGLPTGTLLATSNDGIAQDNEIGLSPGGGSFGAVTTIPKMDPNFKREYATQFSAGFTRQIRPGVGLSFNWFHRTDHNQALLVNRAVDPVTDWTPFKITNPLDGTSITAYNLNAAARTRTPDFYMTNADSKKRQNIYTGYEIAVNGMLPHRGHIMTSLTIDRTTDVTCDMPIGASLIGLNLIDGNNWPTSGFNYNDPNSLRFCDERGLIPFRMEAKVIATMPLKWGFEVSSVFQSSPEWEKYLNWDITQAAIYSHDCVGCAADTAVVSNLTALGQTLTNASERIALSTPGTRYADRLNQWDLGLKKTFKFRDKYRLQAQADVFNVANSHTVLVETQNLGVSKYTGVAGQATSAYSIAPFVLNGPGGRPTSVLQARLLRLAVQFHF